MQFCREGRWFSSRQLHKCKWRLNANNRVIGQLQSYLRLVSRIGETKHCYYEVCPVAEYQIERKYSNQTWKERKPLQTTHAGSGWLRNRYYREIDRSSSRQFSARSSPRHQWSSSFDAANCRASVCPYLSSPKSTFCNFPTKLVIPRRDCKRVVYSL